MKHILFLLSFFFPLFLMSCSGGGDDSTPSSSGNVTVSQTEVSLSGAGASVTVQLQTDHEWGTDISDTWIKMTPSSSVEHSSSITISAEANPDTIAREGTITIKSGTARAYIKVKQAAGAAKEDPYNTPDGYKLVWHDEFNSGTTLDEDWTHEVQKSGWVNNELQNYVNGEIDGNRVTEISDGKLNINCIKYNGKIYSGRVYAKVKTGWKYGYVEARIKLPKGKGTWPAFWMMPVNFKSWPADGEIDIMEEVGYAAGGIHSTIHCNKYNNGGTSIETGYKYVSTAESDYHVYAMKWTATEMIFYVDGETILTYKNDGTGINAWPFDNPFYVILNVAWGGVWGGQQGVNEGALPATMSVDYVRVFQKK